MRTVLVIENNPAHLKMDYLTFPTVDDCQLVIIAGKKPYEEACVLKLAERFHVVLLESFTYDSLLAVAEQLADKYGAIDNIVTCEEIGVNYCGRLKHHFGLSEKHYDRVSDKMEMKRVLSQTLPNWVPKHCQFNPEAYQANKEHYAETLLAMTPLPFFVKPTCLVGSIGAEKLETLDEFHRWAHRMSTTEFIKFNADQLNTFEIDECLSGRVYHCDSFISNCGEIVHTEVAFYQYPPNEFLNGKPHAHMFLPKDHPDAVRLRKATADIHRGLDCTMPGVTHLEVFITYTDEIQFLEIAYRPGGAAIPEMMNIMYGVNLHHAHILLQIDPHFLLPDFTKSTPVLGVIDYQLINGRYMTSNQLPVIANEVLEDKTALKPGETVTESLHMGEWKRRVILKGSNFESTYADFMALMEFKPFVYTSLVPSRSPITFLDNRHSDKSNGGLMLSTEIILKHLQIAHTLVRLPRAPKCVDDIASMMQCSPRSVLKTLMLMSPNQNTPRHFLFTTLGDQQADLSLIAHRVGEQSLKVAPRNSLAKVIGINAGGITPILPKSVLNSIQGIYIDAQVFALDKSEYVSIGSGQPDIGIKLTVAELQRLWDQLGGKVLEFELSQSETCKSSMN